jgi:hypothetical protein
MANVVLDRRWGSARALLPILRFHVSQFAPDGQITENLSSPHPKNIPLSPSGKSALPARAIPFRKRGVGHRHERWDGMRWTRQCARRACQCVRRSRVVLTPRRWRKVLERLTLLGSDGDKKARSPGRARRKPLKPLRRECRTASAEPVCSCALLCASFAHETAGAACTRHSLRPLICLGGEHCKTRTLRVARSWLHIQSSSPAKAGDPVFQRQQRLNR